MLNGFIRIDDDTGIGVPVPGIRQARFQVVQGNEFFIEEEHAIFGDGQGHFFLNFVGGRFRFRQVYRHPPLQGHRQRGDHEKHQQEKHGVDHRNDFDARFLFDAGWKSHKKWTTLGFVESPLHLGGILFNPLGFLFHAREKIIVRDEGDDGD